MENWNVHKHTAKNRDQCEDGGYGRNHLFESFDERAGRLSKIKLKSFILINFILLMERQ